MCRRSPTSWSGCGQNLANRQPRRGYCFVGRRHQGLPRGPLDEAAAEDGAEALFEEEKAPVAKALKNLPGAPPSPALRLEQLADELSLDDLDALIEASQKRKRRKRAPKAAPAKVEEEAQPAVPAATSLTAAFQSPERVAEQKRQEFELLMQDVVYESGSSLTDLRLLEV